MIFLGDFVYPFKKKKKIDTFAESFVKEDKFLNLEGAVLNPKENQILTKGSALHSSKYIYDILNDLNIKAVGMANNHILDFEINIKEQKKALTERIIKTCGVGENLEEALQPAFLEDDKYQYNIFSFGWNVIGCIYAKQNVSGVGPLIEEIIIDVIKKSKNDYPDRKVIIYLHWNYEFEYYPQPADRELAFQAIDAGADAIIGHHPHIVGVYETYKNRPIFYSLGNFFMPTEQGFGERAQIGLGVKYDEKIENIILYWTKNVSDTLELTMHEKLINSKKLEDISNKYQDDLLLYTSWFKVHRRKKKLLPVYSKHEQSLKSSVIFHLLDFRNYLVHTITSLGLRKRKN